MAAGPDQAVLNAADLAIDSTIYRGTSSSGGGSHGDYVDLTHQQTLHLPVATNKTTLSGSSTAISATNEGLRVCSGLSLFSTDPANVNDVPLMVDMIQRTNAGSATIAKTGIHVKAYTQPDNGGDTSGILVVQTGGGNAISAYKASFLRPGGYTDYSSSPQGAAEFATDGQSQALLLGTQFGGGSNAANLLVGIMASNGKGILVQPVDGVTFDTRPAYSIGNQALGTTDTSIHWQVLLDGTQTTNNVNVVNPATSTNAQITVTRNGTGACQAVISAQSSTVFMGSSSNTQVSLLSNSLPAISILTDQSSRFEGPIVLTTVPKTASSGQVSFGKSHQTTVGSAGAASALPATPSGYLEINVEGTAFVIPYYAKS